MHFFSDNADFIYRPARPLNDRFGISDHIFHSYLDGEIVCTCGLHREAGWS